MFFKYTDEKNKKSYNAIRIKSYNNRMVTIVA